MAVTQIGRLHEYVTENGAFWHFYVHIVTDAKMSHFKGKKKWSILASLCIFMQATYLCSSFGAFWQPSRIILLPITVFISRSLVSVDIWSHSPLDLF